MEMEMEMEMITHTPWSVQGSEDTTAIWVEDCTGKRVCTVRNCDTDFDRAKLIAAAPELLFALQEIVRNDPHNQSSAGIVARNAIARLVGWPPIHKLPSNEVEATPNPRAER